jgi:hypothetical protein
MNLLRKVLVLAALITVAGCATDFNGRLATGYQSVTAVRTTTLSLLQAEKIKVDDAQNVQDIADKVRTGLDIARDVHAADPDLGDDKLASALTILETLQKYLGSLL